MIRKDLGAFVAVISHARVDAVAGMQSIIGDATWFVGAGEGEAYARAGAPAMVESGRLCPSRNAALRAAWEAGLPCFQLSDDLRKLEYAHKPGKGNTVLITFEYVVGYMLAAMQGGAMLAGVAPVANAFYYSAVKPYHDRAFIVGDLIAVQPCGLFFDEELFLKEDYDYTMQHLTAFQRVARCNAILATFTHRSNKGGAVEFRTPEREQEAIAHLKARWGSVIRDNPRRPNEILLTLGKGDG